MDNASSLASQKGETVRQVAGSSLGKLVIIVIVAALPAFLEALGGEIYSLELANVIFFPRASDSYFFIEFIGIGYGVGVAGFSLLGGFSFDRFSVRKTILISVAIFSIAAFATGFVTTIQELFATRLVVGIGMGMLQSSALALLGDLFFETRGKAVSVYATFFGFGLLISSYVISPFIPTYWIPSAIYVGLTVLILILIFLFIPGTFKEVGKHDKIRLSDVFNVNIIALSVSLFFFGIALSAGYLGFFQIYLAFGLGIKFSSRNTISLAAVLGGFIFAFLIGFIADRIGRKYMVIFASILVAIGSAGMFLLTSSYYGLMAFTFVFGIGWGIYVDILVALGQDSVNDAIVGTMTGFLFFVFTVGTIIGNPLYSWILSKVSDAFQFKTPSLLVVVLPSIISFVAVLFTKNVKKSNIEEKPKFLIDEGKIEP